MSKKNNRRLLIIIAVLVLIVIIMVYFLSLGKYNYLDEEDKDSKRIKWIDERLKHLTAEITTKAEIKRQLDLKVKRYFLYTRIGLLSIVVLLNWGWYLVFGKISIYSFSIYRPIDKQGIIDTVAVLLDFNQLLLLILFGILFLKFDTLKEVKDVMRLIHLLVKRLVYRKHKGLENEIKEISLEVEKLDKEKKEIEEKKNGSEKP